jgi:antitoxin component YwqK of YwqJK toxin-antitoxin module
VGLHLTEDTENGLSTEWYNNGQKKAEGCREGGRREGLWTTWFEGRKFREVNYSEGKPNGAWTTWFRDGKMKRVGSFMSDYRKDGVWIWYNRDGSEKVRVTYRSGVRLTRSPAS